MTPDEVVKVLKEIKEYGLDPDCFSNADKQQALSTAITLIQDYQKLRERVSVEAISFLIYKHETGLGEELAKANWTAKHFQDKSKINSTPLAQAIVTYLQQPTEH
jgi:hypothetical protein